MGLSAPALCILVRWCGTEGLYPLCPGMWWKGTNRTQLTTISFGQGGLGSGLNHWLIFTASLTGTREEDSDCQDRLEIFQYPRAQKHLLPLPLPQIAADSSAEAGLEKHQ